MSQHFDVLIIGAGLSGIGNACQIAQAHPKRSMALLERRHSIGGTWDLFRYPGVRSDSDMFSFGFKFRPWNALKVMADGPSIRQYIRDTAQQFGIEQKIRFGLKTTSASWCSSARLWTVTALHEESGETRQFTARFVVMCTGYYNYDAGFLPQFAGVASFKGTCVHPQQWPEELDYSGKKVIVIGSGATAVTLVPSMADKAAHVTMLQRSPSYVFSLPAVDKLTAVLIKVMPERWAYALARQRNILIQRALYNACRRWPRALRSFLLSSVRKQVGPDVDMRHFTPKYMPWDERLCAVPDGDLFKVLRSGKASIATDQIDTFNASGILLKSGQQLDADIVVTATGLDLQMLGGIELVVDGTPRPLRSQMIYKGVLVQDVPNLAWVFGYTNAPWTLKSDLAGVYLTRLLRHMDQQGVDVVVPTDDEGCALDQGMLDTLQSGYVQRAKEDLPRQGSKLPWKVLMDYAHDTRALMKSEVADSHLKFTRRMYGDLKAPALQMNTIAGEAA
jgi:monooxygenase